MARKIPSALKDLLILIGVFGVILGGLYLFTGVWPPAVIVESGSMMHRDNEVKVFPIGSYGRLGTIDPGDMVLVKAVDDASAEVQTFAEGGRGRYGAPGDVVVYYPGNNRDRTPIIHRAMAWVDVVVDPDSGARRFLVRWNSDANCPNTGAPPADGRHCVFGDEGIRAPTLGLNGYKPDRSGLVTKGDNPFTNPNADQSSGLSTIVQSDWIEGKARAEIPWLGLIKLAIADRENERNPPAAWVKIGSAYAPKDLWVMLGVSLFLLIGVPIAYDAYKVVDDRRRRANEARLAADAAPPPAATIPPAGGDAPLGGALPDSGESREPQNR